LIDQDFVLNDLLSFMKNIVKKVLLNSNNYITMWLFLF